MTSPSVNNNIRVIFHIDLDSFFVSAERLRRPELIGRCVAVGGNPPRGVISSCSYEARKFGVHSAQPTATALRLCPGLIVLKSDFELYSRLSAQVFSIIREMAPVFEPVSVDEGYLDMTGTQGLFGPPLEAAQRLRARIRSETGLAASIGVASNRLVAKVATDFCKPDNIYVVAPGKEAEFLAPLSAAKLPGVGKATQQWLSDRGLEKIRSLQAYPRELLERNLGQFGLYLHEAAWGRGSVEFFEEAKVRSISRERTFSEDVGELTKLEQCLWEMVVELAQELRAEGSFGKTLRLKLRYPPFQTVTRARTLAKPSQLESELYETALELLHLHKEPGAPLRLIGVGCTLGDGARQLSLFEDLASEKKELELARLKDTLQTRFGPNALRTGRDLEPPRRKR